jgi:hypothetical protein
MLSRGVLQLPREHVCTVQRHLINIVTRISFPCCCIEERVPGGLSGLRSEEGMWWSSWLTVSGRCSIWFEHILCLSRRPYICLGIESINVRGEVQEVVAGMQIHGGGDANSLKTDPFTNKCLTTFFLAHPAPTSSCGPLESCSNCYKFSVRCRSALPLKLLHLIFWNSRLRWYASDQSRFRFQ